MTTIDMVKVLFPALAGIAAFSYYIAHLTEKGASDLAKQQLRQLVTERRLLPAMRAAFVFFLFASDKYFGQKIFSWRALRKSIALSFIWIALVLGICIAIFPNYSNWLGSNISKKLILQSAGVLLIAALLIDYLSVCVTRVITKAAVGKCKLMLILALASDLLISILLFYIIFTFTKSLLQPGAHTLNLFDSIQVWINPGALPIGIELLQPLTSDMLVQQSDGIFEIKGGLLTEIVYAFPESILFMSSLLTSIWLWLYLVGYMLLYAAIRLDRVGSAARKYLKTAEEPVHALALAIVVSFTLLFVVIIALHSVAHII